MSRPLYQVRDLERRYGAKLALRVERLEIQGGSIVGLAGPNGSGKSTLLRILALLDAPTAGWIAFDGRTDNLAAPALRRRLTLLDQTPYLLQRSVFDNVAYGLRVRGETNQLFARVEESLNWVGLNPEDFIQRPSNQLSGGEAQRVALAARLILKPKVLLLDEPTANVDAASAALILAASLRARQEWKTTLIIASHDLAWLFEVADEVLNLFQGRLAGSGVINLLPGPWEQDSQGGCIFPLPDGQRLILPPPPPGAVLASVRPGDLIILPDRSQDERTNLIQGEVAQLSLEKSSGQVLVSVALGRFSLIVRVNQNLMADLALHPGGRVWIHLEPSSVCWV